MATRSAYFLRGSECIPKGYCIRLGLMHVVVVDWLSVKETVADELDKQLRVEENHDCS